MTESYFYTLADKIINILIKGEILLCNAGGEESDFIRFNKGRIRQPGRVKQNYLWLHLMRNKQHTSESFDLSGDLEEDFSRAKDSLEVMRKALEFVKEDPHLLFSDIVQSSSFIGPNNLPPAEEMVSVILQENAQTSPPADLVGIFAGGRMYRGFANSLGQKNWNEQYSFNVNWSYYLSTDKAVKSRYAGFEWNNEEFEKKRESAIKQLSILARPAHTIQPGAYNAYLGPAAIEEFISLACWGGFGKKSRETKHTPFLKMIEGDAVLSPGITILENTHKGIAPAFQAQGYIKPDTVPLIVKGKLEEPLISPRSAKEYNVETNGANGSEYPESIDMKGGSIPQKDILEKLGTGLYINNVWYLNYSDRQAARITGMTRFASFWVEKGEIKAPLNVMRFDETLYRLFGSNLVGLTEEREFIVDPSTYQQRATTSMRLPGALVRDVQFTL